MAVYKYSCRKCPIRNRCINESKYTTSVRNMIRHAFAARTDTLATWGLLQANCLLIKAEEEQEQQARKESTLSRRLREAREAKQKEAQARRPKTSKKTSDSLIRRLPQARKLSEEAAKTRTGQLDAPPRLSPARLADHLFARRTPGGRGILRYGVCTGRYRRSKVQIQAIKTVLAHRQRKWAAYYAAEHRRVGDGSLRCHVWYSAGC